jgi:hypothetical protein
MTAHAAGEALSLRDQALAAGRYNGLGTLAFTTGFLLGPVGGAAALGAGRGSGLFTVMLLACLIAAVAALRLGRHLPTGANQIPRPDAAAARPVPAESPVPSAAGQGGRPGDAEERRGHQQPVTA